MATYYITAISHQTVGVHTFINKVLLHFVQNNKVEKGKIHSKDDVIRLIKSGNAVFSATWNYTGMYWAEGENVGIHTVQGIEYLRTSPDKEQRDNLLHLLPMNNLSIS